MHPFSYIIIIITLKMLNGPSFSSRIKRVYDKYQFVPDTEEKAEETKYTQVHSWDTKMDAPDPIHPHCLHSEMHFITALTAQGAYVKGGVAKTLKVLRARLIGRGVRGFAARVKHCRADDANKQRFLWQAACLHSPSHEGEGGHFPGWCSVAQRLYIYNIFYILRPLRS